MKILDRYLIRETAGPFLFGVVAFVLLFVSAKVLFQLTELITDLGLSLWTATELFVLWLPGFLVLTFPLATLVAMLIAFGRLSGDSELVAMHAGGVSFRRLVAPMMAAGLVISLGTLAMNEFVVVPANLRADEIITAATERTGRAGQQRILIKDMNGDQTARIIYADRLNIGTGEMIRPFIVWFQNGKPAWVTLAERGKWEGSHWQFFNGTNIPLTSAREIHASFRSLRAELPTSPEEIERSTRDPDKMTYRELTEHIRFLLRRHQATAEWRLALQHRLSIPFACLVFALLAPPLGMRSHRGSSSLGMGVAILIGFAYYVVWNYLKVAAERGSFPPFWAAWLPNIVFAAVGIALILRVRR
jgi:lipopolysaccharide export system permease protein